MIPGARSILDAVATCLRGMGELFLPEVCAACGDPSVAVEGLCEDCNIRLLQLVSQPYCPRCGSTLGPGVAVTGSGCSSCPDPLGRYERVFRLGPYADPLRLAVRNIKYHRQELMRRRLGRLLGEAVASGLGADAVDVVLPVPMHWRRRLARGYDHSRLLAQTVARRLERPVGDEIIRVRHTPPQAELSRRARLENMRGAFAMKGGGAVRGARVLLVDDVTTTGATANEAARTLLAGGASSVVLAVIAKADPPAAYAARRERE